MRVRRKQSITVIDQNYLNSMAQKINTQLKVLNDLNQQYKQTQQKHFINIFMNILQKMGNDLILAHQAYRNIDIQVKRDQYCVDLAKQVTYFKNQCTLLNKNHKALMQTYNSLKLDKQNLETQMDALKGSLKKYMQENAILKSQNQTLKKQITKFKNKIAQRQANLFQFKDVSDNHLIYEPPQQQNLNNFINEKRLLTSQNRTRKSYGQSKNNSQTPNTQISFFAQRTHRNTRTSIQKRSFQRYSSTLEQDVQ